ncbi:MAG: hypothetical protein J7K45_03290, partial [Thaumarchaeota archaeon]|nr:hypothetical protein [Nitrososphaerota archaeon]
MMESVYSPNFRALSGKLGPIALVALLLLPVIAAAITLPQVHASPTITLSKTEGYANEWITVTGQGFAANSDVTIKFDSTVVNKQRPSLAGTAPAQVKTDPNGYFKVQIQIPKVKEGSYVIKATDASGNEATATFDVKARIVFRSISYGMIVEGLSVPGSLDDLLDFPAEGYVGDTVGIHLSGFDGSENVKVTIDDTFVVTISVADGYYELYNGTNATIPAIEGAPGGKTVTVKAEGQDSGITATATFTIYPRLYLRIVNTTASFPYERLATTGVNNYTDWYSSIYPKAPPTTSSHLTLEATGLDGSSIENVVLQYTVAGVTESKILSFASDANLTIANGATQGWNATGRYINFTSGSSPHGNITSDIPASDGTPVKVKILTDESTFVFENQLFVSSPGTANTSGIAFLAYSRDATSLTVKGDETFFAALAGGMSNKPNYTLVLDKSGDGTLNVTNDLRLKNATGTNINGTTDANGFLAFTGSNTPSILDGDNIPFGTDVKFGVTFINGS